MTQQKSENSIVPEGLRKLAPTQASADESWQGGGKGVPVNEETNQLDLPVATAENPKGPSGPLDRNLFPSEGSEGQKATGKGEKRASATMERLIEKLGKAWKKVAANKGAPGPDGETIEDVRRHLQETLNELKHCLESNKYEPGDIRRVFIPKPGGKGERGLGIPNVRDRIVQEAIRQVLEPLYEPEFHPSSHGFRPGRSCHTAINQARRYVASGGEWVVDIDLAKYFDRVNHQRLMARLARKVGDKQLLILIGKLLKAKVIMPDGVRFRTEEGVPQGGPLSPLLSNIVLDELDQELERRGHRFVRYADDCIIFVKSQRAGERVMGSITKFLGKRMRLEVNLEKSAVALPNERHFLGFGVEVDLLEGTTEILLSKRSHDRIKARIVELTPRNWGNSMKACIAKINEYLAGWFGFFGICTGNMERTLGNLDAHIRRRLRAIQLKHWKRKSTIAKKLIHQGAKKTSSWRQVYAGKKAIWQMSRMSCVQRAMSNQGFVKLGFVPLMERWNAKRRSIVAPGEQIMLPLG